MMVCPNCGADVPSRAKACPECGSCEETGWSGEPDHAGADIPEEEFDYQDFVQREFGARRAIPRGIRPLWWLVAVILLVLLLAAFFHGI